MKTQLETQIADHIKSLGTPEAVKEFYGVNINQAKTMLRTKKATVAQAGVWMQKLAGPSVVGQGGPALVPGSFHGSVEIPNIDPDPAVPEENSASDTLRAVVLKLNELTDTINEVIAFGNDLEQRLNNTAATVEEGRVTLNNLVDMANAVDLRATDTVAAPARPAGAPLVNGGGFSEPEVISSIRPGRADVPVINAAAPAAPAAPAFKQLNRIGSTPRPQVEPVRRATTEAVQDGRSIAAGTAFNWLKPHAPLPPR